MVWAHTSNGRERVPDRLEEMLTFLKGPRGRWKEVVLKDLENIGIGWGLLLQE